MDTNTNTDQLVRRTQAGAPTETQTETQTQIYSTISGRSAALLAVTCSAIFLDALDTSMVNVALPSIQSDLGMTASSLQWVVAAYVLGFGGFLLFGGRASDLLGRRAVFLIALGVFVAFSAIGGLAWNGELIIVSRFLKGVAAAFTAPAALSLLTTSFEEGAARNRALSYYTATGSAGFTFGLIAGGLLTEVNWRLVFFAPAVIGSMTFLGALAFVPRQKRDAADLRHLDVVGAVTITGSMFSLVLGLTLGSVRSWTDGWTLGAFAAGVVLLLTFIAVERRHPHPLVPLSMFRSWTLVRANLAVLLYVGSWGAAQFIATLYMQETRGWSPLETAAAFWPCGVLGLFVAPYVARLIQRLGLTGLLATGLTLSLIAYLLLQLVRVDSGYWPTIFPAFALIGISFTLVFSAASISATSGVPIHEQGLASGLLQTSMQFGTAALLAITTAVFQSQVSEGASDVAMVEAYRYGWIVPTAAIAVAMILVFPGVFASRRARTGPPLS
jgi:MFS family permease